MMRRLLLVIACCAAAVSVFALPATANNKPTTGTKISLFAPPSTFSANTPFYIEHGFACQAPGDANPSGCMKSSSSFTLTVDGVLQQSTVDVDVVKDTKPFAYIKRYLTNFPGGLPAGSHTFVGEFFQGGVSVGTLSATIAFS